MGENMGERGGDSGKWEGNGRKCPSFTIPFSPFFQRWKTFPMIPFVKIGGFDPTLAQEAPLVLAKVYLVS